MRGRAGNELVGRAALLADLCGWLDAARAGKGRAAVPAAQWAGRGVRVDALSPCFFPSNTTGWLTDPDQVAWISGRAPIGRPPRPDELDGPLLFLASDASTYVTGQNLVVDGGWTTR